MPRRNRPHERSARASERGGSFRADGPPAFGSPTHRESDTAGEWFVRHIPGERATKTYRCPGCDHEIRPRTPHVVAWPADEQGTVAERRHWHAGCWQARHRRGPTRRR